MSRRYSEDLSVSGLAECCSVSVSLLNMLFNRQFKVGPRRYLLSLRMREARRLLLDNRYRIGEVAEQVGFQSANYFARAFKAYHGVTPEAYRNGPPEFADRITFIE
nr:helix-turn-helix transcriptional regulator [Victivallis vadensis]